jgi:hypothetical protein
MGCLTSTALFAYLLRSLTLVPFYLRFSLLFLSIIELSEFFLFNLSFLAISFSFRFVLWHFIEEFLFRLVVRLGLADGAFLGILGLHDLMT